MGGWQEGYLRFLLSKISFGNIYITIKCPLVDKGKIDLNSLIDNTSQVLLSLEQ